MKKILTSFFSLLLFAVAATTATAQPKPKLAVFVVGMDDWKRGDVVAHIVGEELNRDKSYQVVTRSGAVQAKLKALRRASGGVSGCDIRAWGRAHGVAYVCLITSPDNQNFSAQLFDVSSPLMQCSSSRISGFGAVDLKELAWTLTTELHSSSCTAPCADYCEPSIGLEMVYVEGGKFTIGCLSGRDDLNSCRACDEKEKPAHDVEVGSFWIGKYEITWSQWDMVMGTHVMPPGANPDYPRGQLTWYDAYNFCKALSDSTGKTYRLPTEAEWEYAARGGNSCSSKSYMYSGSNNIDDVAWYSPEYKCLNTHIVGTRQGNELGIFDMSGNMIEFTGSSYGSYSTNLYKELAAPDDKSMRALRGGSICHDCRRSRIAYRGGQYVDSRNNDHGFRVV